MESILLVPVAIGIMIGIAILGVVCFGVGCFLCIKAYINQNKVNDNFKRITENLEYSKDVLEYVKMFAAQIITLRFQEFLDNYRLDKVTREKFRNVVEKIINEIHESINMDDFDFTRLMYDKKFIEIYLIQTSMTMCKKMLEKTLIEFEE